MHTIQHTNTQILYILYKHVKKHSTIYSCGSASSLGSLVNCSMKVEGAKVGNRIWMVVFQEMILVNQLNFIPQNMEYIGLESLGTNPNLY